MCVSLGGGGRDLIFPLFPARDQNSNGYLLFTTVPLFISRDDGVGIDGALPVLCPSLLIISLYGQVPGCTSETRSQRDQVEHSFGLEFQQWPVYAPYPLVLSML